MKCVLQNFATRTHSMQRSTSCGCGGDFLKSKKSKKFFDGVSKEGLIGHLYWVAESTKESALLMEQDYIAYAWLFGTGDGVTWSEIIEFDGIATGNIHSDTGFTYNYITGNLGYGDS